MLSKDGYLREVAELRWLGDVLLGLASDETGELLFVRMDYIRAAEKTANYASYSLAHNAAGEPLVRICDGMTATAVVRPIAQKTADTIRRALGILGTLTACGSPDPDELDKGRDGGQIDGQMSMDDMAREE